ncbi:unnamed protein product [Prorocentrum cordatum]|uniref:Uncharacterized protein n=1 Tax=Prorocentrum cordatum TaxID=2364126 RepID=A0ABN9TW61_9DINO|nr:unnamed protein product [Polarella glacialis]
MLASLLAAAASACSRRAPAASLAGAGASLSSAAPGPAVQTANVHLTPCGAGGSPAGAAPGAGPATRDVGAQTEPEEPAWAYAVWACPAAPDLVGVHCGARRAWGAIAGRIGGHRSFRGDRLRRVASEDEAIAGYLAEAARHGADSRVERLTTLLAQHASSRGAPTQSGVRLPDAPPLRADDGRDDGFGESTGMRLGGARGAAALRPFRRRTQSSPRAAPVMARRTCQLDMTGAVSEDTLASGDAERKLALAAAPRAEEDGDKGGAQGAKARRLVGGSKSMDVGIRWGFGLIRRLRGLRTAFGAFVRSSMHAAGRWLRTRVEHMWVNAVVLALSHLHLGESRSCPPRARAGRPLSSSQSEMVSRLKRLVRPMCQPLQWQGGRVEKADALLDYLLNAMQLPLGAAAPSPDCEGATVDPSKAPFAKAECHFDPLALLAPFSAATFLEPRLLAREGPGASPLARAVGPPTRPAPARPARQTGKPGDLLQYLKQWDDVGRLELGDVTDSPQALRGTLFPVFKDANTQRVVFNRIARNSAELPLGGFSRLTPGAATLVGLEVPAGFVLRVWADDLQDFYPAYDCTYDMACTNDAALHLPTRLYEGFAALGRLRRRCRREGRELPEKVVPCHGGLIMGGLSAPDWACESHMRLLAHAGSFPPERRVLNRHLAPEGSVWEAVVLGDHFGLAVDAPGSREARRAIEEPFARAREGYAKAGLRVSAGKEVKDAAEATVIGAELLGHDRLVGASRTRRLALAWMGLSMARGRRSTTLGLQRFLGMGLFAALFRRPTLSLLHYCYKEVDVGRDPHEVFDLSSAACNECALFAVLLPLMATDLSAGWGPHVLASDASHLAGASVKTPASVPSARAFWRQREQRGARTWLDPSGWAALANPEDGAVLQDLGEDAAPLPDVVDPTASLIEYFDVLELCCGEEARLMGYLADRGLRTGPGIDIKCHKYWDLVDSRLAEWVVWLIWQRRVKMTISQVPCTSFSIARHPRLRSRMRPWGFDPSSTPTRLGNGLCRVGMLALFAHLLSGHGAGLHGHPLTAYSWYAHIVEFLLTHEAVERFDLSMCQFGAPWKKDTSLLVVRGPWLAPMARRCRGGHMHTVLEGCLTPKAALYPHGFCSELSKLIADHVDGPNPPPPAESSAPAGAFEALWLNNYVDSAPWQLHCHRPFRRPLHINLLEIHAACDAVDEQGPRFSDCKRNLFLDSRVSIGAISKGRSSSTAINKLLRRRAPLQLATGSYVGCHFVPTRLQPADAPSRNLRDPASALARGAGVPFPAPSWLAGLEAGGASAFRAWAALPLQRRQQSRWAWLVACLWWRGLLRLAPRPRVRDPALQLPGPAQPRARPVGLLALLLLLRGPAAAPRPPTSRPAEDLAAARSLTPVVQERRAALALQLQQWLAGRVEPRWGLFILMDPAPVARHLAKYGPVLYDAMRSRHDYDETTYAVVDAHRALRHPLDAAWGTSFAGEHLTLGSNHQAMPEALPLALVSLALALGWPFEFLTLRFGDQRDHVQYRLTDSPDWVRYWGRGLSGRWLVF